jgi:hypothetical protein
MATNPVRQFRLHARGALPIVEGDKGELLTAEELVARPWCRNRIAPKTFRKLFARHIGMKPGRAWLFYENEARAMWAQYLEGLKGEQRGAA